MNTKREKQGKAMQCIGAPLRVLAKAGDYYMRGMMGCSGSVGYGALVGCPALQVSPLPKSSRVVSRGGDGDLRELMGRVARRSTGGRKVETAGSHGVVIRRRRSNAGLGRIDEEKPCLPVEDDEGKLRSDDVLYPRSRSCAVKR